MHIPSFTMRQLLESGVHYGHTPRRWNAKMAPYIFGVRNGVHIIDLRQTMPLMQRALQATYDVAASGGRVLFVATKRQAQSEIAEAAQRCGQYYVNFRWLGGMMTNWKTITNSIARMKALDIKLADEQEVMTKKERLGFERSRDKLERALGGIRDMSNLPDIIIVIDSIKEAIAIKEANKLGIPVVAVIDSNSDPDGIDYPVPGNDDALRSIHLYCELFAGAVLAGIEQSVMQSDADAGEDENIADEAILSDAVAADESSESASESISEPIVAESPEPSSESDVPESAPQPTEELS